MKGFLYSAVAGLVALIFSGLTTDVLAAPAASGSSPTVSAATPVSSPSPVLCGRCKLEVDPKAAVDLKVDPTSGAAASLGASSSAPVASPTVAKSRALPFSSAIISVDKAANSFRVGKKKIRVIHVTPETRLLLSDGRPATFQDVVVGAEVRGSCRKRMDEEFDAVLLKIGPKLDGSASATAETTAKSKAKALEKPAASKDDDEGF